MHRREINLSYVIQEIVENKACTISHVSFSQYLCWFPSKVSAQQRSDMQMNHGLTVFIIVLQHMKSYFQGLLLLFYFS